MKKFLLAVIVAALLLCVCAQSCSKNSGKETGSNKAETSQKAQANEVADVQETPVADVSKKTEGNKEASVEVAYCVFTEKLTATDKECVDTYYPKQDGKVFVDLALNVVNTTDDTFGKNNVTGYFLYNDLSYDLVYAYDNQACTSIEIVDGLTTLSQAVQPGTAGTVHLVTPIEEVAMNTPITVHYTINGVEYTQEVKRASTDVMDNKTRLSVGSKLDVNGFYEIEVISCKTKDYLTAYDISKSSQYEPTDKDKKFFELLLKINNKSDIDLKELWAYSVIDGEIVLANVDRETKSLMSDNIDLVSLGGFLNSIIAGEETYLHIYTLVDKNAPTSDLSMRFNLGNTRFYCPIQG